MLIFTKFKLDTYYLRPGGYPGQILFSFLFSLRVRDCLIHILNLIFKNILKNEAKTIA